MASSGKSPLVAITGASSGIGTATAHRFAKAGYRLALIARRLDKLSALKSQIKTEASTYKLDVRSHEEVAETFQQIENEIGPIDILVNSAGCGFGLEPAHEANVDEWDQCVDTNIKGLMYCTREVLPSMVKRNRGHIINLGSIAGQYPYPGGNVYGATKAFVHQFSLNLRADLLGKDIRVSCIEPGLTGGTEFSAVRFRGDQTMANRVYENTQPLLPEDIAEVIFFCCSVPPHVNLNVIEMMPVCQASGALAVHRDKK